MTPARQYVEHLSLPHRPQEALDFCDHALKAAAAVDELQVPVMTYVGRSNARTSSIGNASFCETNTSKTIHTNGGVA